MATYILLICSFLFRRWGDDRPLPSSKKNEQTYEFKKKENERGMATFILNILPSGDGEMIASLHFQEKSKDSNQRGKMREGWSPPITTMIP